MSKRTTLTAEAATLTVNLRTRSTGTVHAANADGSPMCPTRVTADALEVTFETATCRSCLKLQPLEVPPADEPATVRPATVELAPFIPAPRSDTPAAPLLPRGGWWQSDEQLDGLACIRCASVDAPMVPAGIGERGQLFECACHTSCPAWCATNHMGGIDVEHVSDLITVAAPEGSEVTGDDGHVRTMEVVADLIQIPGEALRVSVGVCEGVECLGSADMSIDETELMVTHLQTIIAAARTGARL